MLPADRLRDKLIVMNGKGVQVYHDLTGAYRFDRFELYLDVIHPDPVAPYSHARIRIDQAEAQIPRALWEDAPSRLAVQDFLARAVREAIHRYVHTRWSGRVQPLAIEAGGQEVLARTCCAVAEDFVEIRLTIALPAEGRKVLARAAQTLLFEELPAVVGAGLVWEHLDGDAGRRHCATYADYLALQSALPSLGLVAFIADGSALVRDAAPGDRPLRGSRVVAMQAPEDLAVTITLPHRGAVRGLGIRRGVTVVAGASYSGKSTLLAAIVSGVYPHVPGDGRELVATVPDAVAIRAETGRRIERVDVRAFAHFLPHRPDAAALSVERATGAVSMAASVAEAVEIGTGLLLYDEDQSAIAFLVRDEIMQHLAQGSPEPITPLVDQMRVMWESHGVSSIIATGGLGDYLGVADTVIAMQGFQPVLATDRARSLVTERGLYRSPQRRTFDLPAPRCPLPRGIGGVKGRGLHAELRGRETLNLGRDAVDLAAVPQLVDAGQARAAGDAILYAVEKDYVTGNAALAEILDRVFADIEMSGLGVLATQEGRPGDYALPRRHEVVAVLNRLKSLQVRTRRVGMGAHEAQPPVARAPEGLAPEVPVPPEGAADEVESSDRAPDPHHNQTS
ncbi:MAG: P-loop domain-containing protein [Armatimonadota bacterium]